MNNVFRILSEYLESDTASSDLRTFFFLIWKLLYIINFPGIYRVKGFLASSHSNAIRMYVIVTWML
jgi:hypothetical protein